MDFDLSEDQAALVEAAAALLGARAAIDKVREASDRPERIDRSLWAQMSEQGWLGVEQSEAAGGLGMGFVEVAVLCEQIGAHLAPVPFAGTVLALGALAEGLDRGHVGASEAGAEEVGGLVDRLAGGDAIGAVASVRHSGHVEARRAVHGTDNDSWVLNGRPEPVIFGPVADVVVVAADIPADTENAPGTRGEARRALFAVTEMPGSSRSPEPAMDLTRSLSWLNLDETAAVRIGDEEACERLADRAAVAASAEMLGSAQRVLDMSVQYAKDRYQFGRPIGSFQAIKHRCADMLVDVEGMRSAVYYAAWCIAAGARDARPAASAAKIWCSEAASRVMASGLQVHGGIGFTWEHDLHMFVKRSQLDQVSFGTAGFHKDRLAAILRPLAEAGLPVL
jgi:alkylation response protein AidB-like acyl-CoA dehydrogenase